MAGKQKKRPLGGEDVKKRRTEDGDDDTNIEDAKEPDELEEAEEDEGWLDGMAEEESY